MAHGTGNSRRTGVAVFVALLLLTVVTVLVSYVDLGLWNTVVALLIASVKASLVALFFMHLKGESRLVWGSPCSDRLPRPHPPRHALRHDVALIPRCEDNLPIRRGGGRRCSAG